MKSKLVAYVLWFFLGLLGIHKFYIGKIGMGVLYLLTGGIFFIGWFIDLFTLSGQVDVANALAIGKNNLHNQNIVVNVNSSSNDIVKTKVSAEKEILQITREKQTLTLKDIVTYTSLESDEAETALKNLVDQGMAKELVTSEGKISYDFS